MPDIFPTKSQKSAAVIMPRSLDPGLERSIEKSLSAHNPTIVIYRHASYTMSKTAAAVEKVNLSLLTVMFSQCKILTDSRQSVYAR